MVDHVHRAAGPAIMLAALAVSSLLIGCGGAEEGTVPISGAVTLDGKPVDGAAVGFIGRNGARLATAQTDSAGKFSIVAALGKNVVTVAKATAAPIVPAAEEETLMPTDQQYQKIVQQQEKSEIPAKYGDPATSGLSIEAIEGMSEVEFALSSK